MICQDLINLVIAHTSTDETRFHLCGVHYDGDRFVATDGHRLIVVEAKDLPSMAGLKAGEIYKSKAFKDWDLVRIDGKYPNYKQLMPDAKKANYVFQTRIPSWCKGIKHKRGAETRYLGINADGEWTLGACIAQFDVSYLGLYAGIDVELSIDTKDTHIGPMHIKSLDKALPFEAVVMPMRAGKYPVKVVRKPKPKTEEVLASQMLEGVTPLHAVKS